MRRPDRPSTWPAPARPDRSPGSRRSGRSRVSAPAWPRHASSPRRWPRADLADRHRPTGRRRPTRPPPEPSPSRTPAPGPGASTVSSRRGRGPRPCDLRAARRRPPRAGPHRLPGRPRRHRPPERARAGSVRARSRTARRRDGSRPVSAGSRAHLDRFGWRPVAQQPAHQVGERTRHQRLGRRQELVDRPPSVLGDVLALLGSPAGDVDVDRLRQPREKPALPHLEQPAPPLERVPPVPDVRAESDAGHPGLLGELAVGCLLVGLVGFQPAPGREPVTIPGPEEQDPDLGSGTGEHQHPDGRADDGGSHDTEEGTRIPATGPRSTRRPRPEPATAHGGYGSGTASNVSGRDSDSQRETGHTTAKARPVTRSSGTVPLTRESPEFDRWSPITNSSSSGTSTSNSVAEGSSPGRRYGDSSTATPLTVMRPSSSQHTTVSPPRPITRLIRCPSESSGSTPTNCSASRSRSPSDVVPSSTDGDNHPSGSANTTTSPRWISPNRVVSFDTSTRSPTRSVSSIDWDGIRKAWTRKIRTRVAMTSDRATTIAVSRSTAGNPPRRRFAASSPPGTVFSATCSPCRCRARPAMVNASGRRADDARGRRYLAGRSTVRTGSDGVALLADLRRLAPEVAQVVKLGPPDVAASHALDLVDHRCMQWKGALDADAEAHLADGERLTYTRALAADHDALEDLDAAPAALDDLDVDLEGVAGTERGNVVAQAGGVDGVQGVHRFADRFLAGATGHRRNGCQSGGPVISVSALPPWQGHEIRTGQRSSVPQAAHADESAHECRAGHA